MACSECGRPVLAKGLCRRHYVEGWRATKVCAVDGCEKAVLGRELCSAHYARWRRHGDTAVVANRWDGFDRRCEATGCDEKHYAQGFCKAHYRAAFPEKNPNRWNDQRRAQHHARRAKKLKAATGAPVLLGVIRERDGNRCGICGKSVGDKVWPHPLSASLDHMVPLSQGGAHDPTNVQLAHLGCNVRKGPRGGGEQLRIV